MDIQQELAAIAVRLQAVTVQVRGSRMGIGSGIIWHSNGQILTNAHVATGTTALIELADGRSYPARVIAKAPQHDLAVLQMGCTNLPAATVADSRQLRVGELVLAVGNPLGLVGALAIGIVTALPTAKTPWIQTDVRLAPGNSGGLLANAQGQVIGINSMIVNGLGFAVPSHTAQQWLASAWAAA